MPAKLQYSENNGIFNTSTIVDSVQTRLWAFINSNEK